MHHSQKRYKTLYFFAALIAAAFSVLLIELGGIGDSDYYWHIVLGREICSTHTIPVADAFSWISQDLGLTETAHSWLSSIILYQFSCISSNPVVGLLIYSFITAFLYALFIEYAWAKELRDPFENCLFVTIVTALLSWKTSEHRHDSLCGLFLFLERPVPEPGLETMLAIAGFEFPLGEPAWRVFAYPVRVHCSFHSDVLSAQHQYLRSCQ